MTTSDPVEEYMTSKGFKRTMRPDGYGDPFWQKGDKDVAHESGYLTFTNAQARYLYISELEARRDELQAVTNAVTDASVAYQYDDESRVDVCVRLAQLNRQIAEVKGGNQ